jgi:hypothetical protein
MAKNKRTYKVETTISTPVGLQQKSTGQDSPDPQQGRLRKRHEFIFTPQLIHRIIERIKRI